MINIVLLLILARIVVNLLSGHLAELVLISTLIHLHSLKKRFL